MKALSLLFICLLISSVHGGRIIHGTRKLRQSSTFGEDCSSNDECVGLYICNDQGFCDDNFGIQCTSDSDCSDSDNGNLYCYGSGVDWRLCGYQPGDSCDSADQCAGNLDCSQNVCADNFGESCTYSDECTGDQTCDGPAGDQHCGFPLGHGCGDSSECAGTFECSSDGICSVSQGTSSNVNTQPTDTPIASTDTTTPVVPLPVISIPSPIPIPSPSPKVITTSPRPSTATTTTDNSGSETDAMLAGSEASYESDTSSSGLSSAALAGIIVGSVAGGILLIGLLFLAIASSRPTGHPFMRTNITWPPRELTDPRLYREYFVFWYGKARDPRMDIHRRWHPFLDLHGNCISPPQCQPEARPAVYEFGLVHVSRRNVMPVPVYVGKAGGADGLKGRHAKYESTNGDHIRHLIEYAQQRGCLIFRRYVYDNYHHGGEHGAGDRTVTQMETRFLSYFDYAFNKQANDKERYVYLKPRSWLGIFPAGIYIMNDSAEPPFPRAFPPPNGCYNNPLVLS